MLPKEYKYDESREKKKVENLVLYLPQEKRRSTIMKYLLSAVLLTVLTVATPFDKRGETYDYIVVGSGAAGLVGKYSSDFWTNRRLTIPSC